MKDLRSIHLDGKLFWTSHIDIKSSNILLSEIMMIDANDEFSTLKNST
jgi:hypothetical protein